MRRSKAFSTTSRRINQAVRIPFFLNKEEVVTSNQLHHQAACRAVLPICSVYQNTDLQIIHTFITRSQPLPNTSEYNLFPLA